MKYLKKHLMIAMAALMLVAATGCYGSFGLTTKLYKWNGTLGDKWINSCVFFALCVIPVYEITAFVDFIVLNTVEFWTGSNPISMNEGDSETQIVSVDNKVYEITATKNRFHIIETQGPDAGKSVDLVYNETETAWYAQSGTEMIKLAQGDANSQIVKMFYPNGDVKTVALN